MDLMTMPGRRRQAILFIVLGSVLVALTVALNIGWVVLNWRTGAMLALGVVFFGLVIAGVVLNTIFLVREIRRNEQQDAFLNAVTHELKTPVASIRLYLETMQQREIPEARRKEFYRIMLDDTNRLLGTIEQVLEVSRVGQRKGGNTLSVSFLEVVEDSLAVVRLRHHLEHDQLHFESKLPTGDRATLLADPQELKSAVSNLFDNAIKYSTGEVRVVVELERLTPRRIALHVKDHGVGIATDQLKRIFGRFYRIPGALAGKIKGTGLGLFIVRSVARKYRGRVYAESDGLGKGSTFTFELESSFQLPGGKR